MVANECDPYPEGPVPRPEFARADSATRARSERVQRATGETPPDPAGE